MAFGGRSQLKMSEETFDFVCTTCAKKDRIVEAVKYCVECSGYCCQSCVDIHMLFPTLETHNLMEVSQGNQASGDQSSVFEFPTERCSIHKGKVVDMYCESHDTVGCYACIAKDHKSCQDIHIHSIPDMIDTIFKLSDFKQTCSLLKDMMVSMETVSKSKDTQLQTLNKAKQDAQDKVTTFQKALEAIVRKAAEFSRQEVEAAYKELEIEIQQEKQNAADICEDLKIVDDKLTKSDGNRAQSLVCAKLAAVKIKDSERMKQELLHHKDVLITFVPDQSLMDFTKPIQSIGQVQKHGKMRRDLYKIKRSRDIHIELSDDHSQCSCHGSCLIHDNQLLVTDCNNRKLKSIDVQTMSVVDSCSLEFTPSCVCCIGKHEVAVACWSGNTIQFVSTKNKMSLSRQIKLSHRCLGIASNDGKLYVTDSGASLYIYDMTGTLLKMISRDNAGNRLFGQSRHINFNERGSNMFVGGGDTGLVRFDVTGNYLSTIKDTDLSYANGVCVDGRGNMFVVGQQSHNVVQYNENGKKVGVIVQQRDGLKSPVSACFHQGLNRILVTMVNSDVVKMYELE